MDSNHTRSKILAELKKNSDGLTILQISERLGSTRQTASKYVYGLVSEGAVVIRKVGPAKICYLKK